ncbi:hypothetical protein SDC9_45177 [bioreactor metagenome]|uniref:Uncharacterized protein n=1 Tax=bioreactor metagenome TaxID=1076179 RepID=A0A644W5C8_9ZZZZ
MESIAHIRRNDKKIQTVEQHLLEVKNLAESYGKEAKVSHITGLAGLLHDLGKFTQEFSTYIKTASENPDNPPKRGSVDHSTAGGMFLYELLHKKDSSRNEKILAELVGNAIISHHGFLKDFNNPSLESKYLERVSKEGKREVYAKYDEFSGYFYEKVMDEESFSNYVNKALVELSEYISQSEPTTLRTSLYYLTTFIFSALVDADRTNTRHFEDEINEQKISNHELFQLYETKLNDHLIELQKSPKSKSEINKLRMEMSNQCEKCSENESGIYSLSIPTGGGKTLASLRYALKHALKHNKERIIYVIPYTSIIDQNAKLVKEILDDDINIIEHHSNVDFGPQTENELSEELDEILVNKTEKIRLATDNWDAPIIFTTMVQYLNAFYAKGNRYTRRLHNLTNAVIIFDEVQKVPSKCLSLFTESVNFLDKMGNSSVLLCTATQPSLETIKRKIHVKNEIVENLPDVVKAFKRTEIIDKVKDGKMSREDLKFFVGNIMDMNQSLLIILNTKRVAKELYAELDTSNVGATVYHLSTSMCAKHRMDVLEKVRNDLDDGKKVICVSTQLIEAGVDVSFECVIRSLAGIDSIAQAAGRCNRNGEKKIGNVYIIDYGDEKLGNLSEIEKGQKVTRQKLIDLANEQGENKVDLLSPEVIKLYFEKYYNEIESLLDYPLQIVGGNMNTTMVNVLLGCPFMNEYISKSKENRSKVTLLQAAHSYAAEQFFVIDQNTKSIIVPYDKVGEEIIADLNRPYGIEKLSVLLKKAQQYTVNVYENDFKKLSESKALRYLYDGSIYTIVPSAYSKFYGIDLDNSSLVDVIQF